MRHSARVGKLRVEGRAPVVRRRIVIIAEGDRPIATSNRPFNLGVMVVSGAPLIWLKGKGGYKWLLLFINAIEPHSLFKADLGVSGF